MDHKLQKLAFVAVKLDVASEDCNERIDHVEDNIGRTGIGLSVWLLDRKIATETLLVDPNDVYGSSVDTYYELGYAKCDGKWRIAVRELRGATYSDALGEEIAPPMPLRDAPRFVRLASVEHLEELVESLTKKASTYLRSPRPSKEARLDAAVRIVRELVGSKKLVPE